MFSRYSSARFTKENCVAIPYLFKREQLLPYVGRAVGLDTYISAQK